MTILFRVAVLLLCLVWWSAASWAECPDLQIEEASGIAFGQISVPTHGGAAPRRFEIVL